MPEIDTLTDLLQVTSFAPFFFFLKSRYFLQFELVVQNAHGIFTLKELAGSLGLWKPVFWASLQQTGDQKRLFTRNNFPKTQDCGDGNPNSRVRQLKHGFKVKH